MPRTARMAPGGMVFHVLNRGVGRMRLFLKTLQSTTPPFVPPRYTIWIVLSPQFGVSTSTYSDLAQVLSSRIISSDETPNRGGRESLGVLLSTRPYVERNAYRAKLAKTPDAWRWSSAWRHAQGNPQQRKLLSAWPLPRPRNWNQLLRDPQGTAELHAIRRSVNKGQPFGSENWVKRTAKRLGLESTLRRRGRPRKYPGSHRLELAVAENSQTS